jgi:hypothetical protein
MKAIGYKNNLPIEVKSLEDIVLEATKSKEIYLSGDKSHISKPSRL